MIDFIHSNNTWVIFSRCDLGLSGVSESKMGWFFGFILNSFKQWCQIFSISSQFVIIPFSIGYFRLELPLFNWLMTWSLTPGPMTFPLIIENILVKLTKKNSLINLYKILIALSKGREVSFRFVIASQTSLARTRTIINNNSWQSIIIHFSIAPKTKEIK